MAERVIALSITIKGTKEETLALQKLQAGFDSVKKEIAKVNVEERKGIITAQEASRTRAQLNVQLIANRNALTDLQGAILKNNDALKKNSGFVAGIKKGIQEAIPSFGQLAGALGLAFGVQQIVAFGKEALDLAAKGEGIRKAFSKIGGEEELEKLRVATRGAVSDIDLMSQALRAGNFGISTDLLAKGLEFAGKVARQTGQDVNFLADSFVNGVGRKSALILDNLGISAVRLQEEVKRLGGDFNQAVENIVSQRLEEIGDVSETTADKIAQMQVSIANFKESVGAGFIEAIIKAKDALALLFGKGDDIANLDARNKSLSEHEKRVRHVTRVYGELSNEQLLAQRKFAEEQLKAQEVEQSIAKNNGARQSEITERTLLTLAEIEAIDALIKQREKDDKSRKASGNNIEFLRDKIKGLNELFEKEAIGSDAFFSLQKEIEATQKLLDEATGKAAEERRKAREKESSEQLKALDVYISVALKLYKHDTDNFVKEEKAKTDALIKRINDNTDLLFKNQTLEASLTDSLLDDEEARYQEALHSFKIQLDDKGKETAASLRYRELLELQHQKNVALIQKNSLDEYQKAIKEFIESPEYQTFSGIGEDILQGVQQIQQNNTDKRISQIESVADAQVAAIDRQIEAQKSLGNNTDTLEKRKQQLIEQTAKKIKDEQKKQFDRNKKFSTASAVILGAEAILKTFAQYGFTPVGIAAAALQAIATGIQVSAIQGQQFAEGGIIPKGGGIIQGRSHAQGGVKFNAGGITHEAQGGEPILVKEAGDDPVTRNILSQINVSKGGRAFARGGIVPAHKFQSGGMVPSFTTRSASQAAQGLSTQQLLGMINEMVDGKIANIKVTNVATETAATNSKVVNIQSDVSFR